AEPDRRKRRRRLGRTGERSEARDRFGQRAGAGTLGPRPGRPVRRQVDDDETRVAVGERLAGESEALEALARQVRDQQVGALEQPLEERAALGRRDVERDALLVPVHDLPLERGAARVDEPAKAVAARMLDLDHARAEVPEEGGDLRGRAQGREVDDGEAGERHAAWRSVRRGRQARGTCATASRKRSSPATRSPGTKRRNTEPASSSSRIAKPPRARRSAISSRRTRKLG